jgi:hypothetical protein
MHIYQAPDGRADTTPDEVYVYIETYADAPAENTSDQGTLPELISRHPILEWMQFDESLLYEPVVMKLPSG